MNSKNKLALKYKNQIIAQCSDCCAIGNFSSDCKNGCFEKVEKGIGYINAGIPTKYIDLSLKAFNEYTKKSKTVELITRRNRIFEAVQDYLKNLELNLNLGKGFLFFGNFGTGKSTLSMNIAKACIDAGKIVGVREFSEMVKISQSGFEIGEEIEIDIFQEFLSCDAYFIENLDWVYQKNNSDYVSMFLDNLVSLAFKYNISLIITSNMSDKDIKKNFNEHIYSLLHENCQMFDVPGEDIRLKKQTK